MPARKWLVSYDLSNRNLGHSDRDNAETALEFSRTGVLFSALALRVLAKYMLYQAGCGDIDSLIENRDLSRLVRVSAMMRDMTHVVDLVDVEPARKERILTLHEQLCKAAKPQHRRQHQPDDNDRLPWNENDHYATSRPLETPSPWGSPSEAIPGMAVHG